MPLGIDNNNAIASIISRGGEFLAQQQIQAGEKIEAGLMRMQAFRQTRDLGQQMAQLNPNAPDFPQAVTLLASQYPLSIQSGLGLQVMKPQVDAYNAAQKLKQAQVIGDRQVNLANINHQNRLSEISARTPAPFTGSGSGNPAPDLSSGEVPDVELPRGLLGAPQRWAAQSIAGATNPMLPPLPDGQNGNESIPNAAVGMRQADWRPRPIQDYVEEVGADNKKALSVGGQAPWPKIEQVQREAWSRKKYEDKQHQTAEQKSLEDFATSEGLERIGDSNYFTREGQGRYSITRNAKGQYTFKDAPPSTDPTAEGRRQRAEDRRQLQSKFAAAKSEWDIAKNNYTMASEALKRVSTGSANPQIYRSLTDFKTKSPEAYEKYQKALDKVQEKEADLAKAETDFHAAQKAVSAYGEDLEEIAPPSAGTKLRWDGSKLVPR